MDNNEIDEALMKVFADTLRLEKDIQLIVANISNRGKDFDERMHVYFLETRTVLSQLQAKVCKIRRIQDFFNSKERTIRNKR